MARVFSFPFSRSFSGVPVWGNDALRLVYVDETGISNPQHDPWVVVVGVIVGDNELNGIRSHLERILHRHLPAHLASQGYVLHCKELFHGGKFIRKPKSDLYGPPEWPMERRMAIFRDVLHVVKKFKLPIAAGAVEKADFMHQMRDENETAMGMTKIVAAHVTAYVLACVQVEHWMRANKPNENCLMIVEDNADARKHIRDVQVSHQNPAIKQHIDPDSAKFLPLRKIQEDLSFQPKRPSNPLILADFIAYVLKRGLVGDPHMKESYLLIRDQIIIFDPESGFGKNAVAKG